LNDEQEELQEPQLLRLLLECFEERRQGLLPWRKKPNVPNVPANDLKILGRSIQISLRLY
jgi:hypothetical protein